MPFYSFICEECEASFVVVMNRQEYTSKVACERCKSENTYRDLAADMPINKDAEPKTVGSLADKNAKNRS